MDDAKKAEAQMRKVKDLQKWIDGYREVKTMADELELAFDFCKMIGYRRRSGCSVSKGCHCGGGIGTEEYASPGGRPNGLCIEN